MFTYHSPTPVRPRTKVCCHVATRDMDSAVTRFRKDIGCFSVGIAMQCHYLIANAVATWQQIFVVIGGVDIALPSQTLCIQPDVG